MNGDFLTVCHTCAEKLRSDTFERADDFYTEHAAAGHAVETINLASYDRHDPTYTGKATIEGDSRRSPPS